MCCYVHTVSVSGGPAAAQVKAKADDMQAHELAAQTVGSSSKMHVEEARLTARHMKEKDVLNKRLQMQANELMNQRQSDLDKMIRRYQVCCDCYQDTLYAMQVRHGVHQVCLVAGVVLSVVQHCSECSAYHALVAIRSLSDTRSLFHRPVSTFSYCLCRLDVCSWTAIILINGCNCNRHYVVH